VFAAITKALSFPPLAIHVNILDYLRFRQRAQQTLEIALKISGQEHVPVNANWRLNERMYGALTG
jgi:2,3-bisphosphoglycerate-dependent phosphoglycerate mutase